MHEQGEERAAGLAGSRCAEPFCRWPRLLFRPAFPPARRVQVDGAVGAQWLQAFKSYLEDPATMLL